MADSVDLYNTTYGTFEDATREQVRRETYGEDLGQSGWLTTDEMLCFIDRLDLSPAAHVLEIGSGSGGPALFLAERSGARVTGIDINEHGVATANQMARHRGLDRRAHFLQADAGRPLPFGDDTFDAVISVDAMCHIPPRAQLFAELRRVLKPGGRLLFTDPVVVTGPVSKEEIAIRSSIGYFLFVPPGVNERLLRAAGFSDVQMDDATANTALVARRWHDARDSHRDALIEVEGEETYEGLQRFLATTSALATERRLSRHVLFGRKPAA